MSTPYLASGAQEQSDPAEAGGGVHEVPGRPQPDGPAQVTALGLLPPHAGTPHRRLLWPGAQRGPAG